MNTVRSLYNGKTSLETSFSLHINWKVREKEETKNGKLYLAPRDKFRVEMGEATLVCDGETYWQSTRDDQGEQVVIKRMADVDLNAHPSHVLSTYLDKFTYRLKEERGEETVVQWKADSSSEAGEAAEIKLSVERRAGIVTSLFILDKSGNESSYTFKKTKTGMKIPDKLFVYSIPKGASILDMRK